MKQANEVALAFQRIEAADMAQVVEALKRKDKTAASNAFDLVVNQANKGLAKDKHVKSYEAFLLVEKAYSDAKAQQGE